MCLILMLVDMLQDLQQQFDVSPRRTLQVSDEFDLVRQQVWPHAQDHKAAYLLA
jgi:hypothetical protein